MTAIDKKQLSERDICTKFITPAIEKAGWNIQTQVREEVSFTNGRVIVRGKMTSRGQKKRADYILYYRHNIPIAIIEAKDNNHEIGAGMQQALDYGRILDLPFIFSSNGDGFIEHDRTVDSADNGPVEKELAMDEFPSPEFLWERYCKAKGFTNEESELISQPYYVDSAGKMPRYYQMIAINRTVEAIAKGQNRILLVMATGTGKTYTAMQIIWRLWKSGKKKRILFLADRNILVDQTMVNDFKPFKGVMAKLSMRSKTIEKENGEFENIPSAMKDRKTVDKSYEVYLGLYQSLTGIEEKDKVFKNFSKDFFDLIVIDECHRGSAADDSQWREILKHFENAAQIGMTATPKETKYVSNIDYFGKPVYMYSLKDGIADGFLAPYKVIRIGIDKDLLGWRPETGKRDKHGQMIPDREYNEKDYDRELVLEKRTELVAKKVTQFLIETNRFDKTIIFCVDIDHAERMRMALVNENPGLVHASDKYIMRITGDNEEGKRELDNFIDPESKYPVIVTTSKLMSTGVDAKTCKLIVLDRNINSMTEFKQIIGRGTRIDEDYNKTWFTIIDFRKATELFADPDFDGDPVQIYEPGEEDPVAPPDEELPPEENDDGTEVEPINTLPPGPGGEITGGEPRKKYYVKDVEVNIIGERVQYYGADGKLITESLKDYTKKTLEKEYRTLNDFLKKWSSHDKKTAVIKQLEEMGVLFGALEEEAGKDLDPFDLICHVAYGKPALTRRERAEKVKKRNYFEKYGETARKVINALLDKYADAGISDIENTNVLKLDPFNKMGTLSEIIHAFGSKEKYMQAVSEMESYLYESAS